MPIYKIPIFSRFLVACRVTRSTNSTTPTSGLTSQLQPRPLGKHGPRRQRRSAAAARFCAFSAHVPYTYSDADSRGNGCSGATLRQALTTTLHNDIFIHATAAQKRRWGASPRTWNEVASANCLHISGPAGLRADGTNHTYLN